MKNTMMKRVLPLVLCLCLLCALAACGGDPMKKLAGTYKSDRGSTLLLYEDGTCSYGQTKWKEFRDGTWKVEDDKLTVSGPLDYDIYAILRDDDHTALLFQADSSRWNAGVFTKVS